MKSELRCIEHSSFLAVSTIVPNFRCVSSSCPDHLH